MSIARAVMRMSIRAFLLATAVIAALTPALALAQSREAFGRGSLSERDFSERVRRALLGDLAETFPDARVRVAMEDRRVRMSVEVDTPQMSEQAALDVLETVKNLAASNVELHAPGFQLTNDSTFAARADGKVLTRRAVDLGGLRARAVPAARRAVTRPPPAAGPAARPTVPVPDAAPSEQISESKEEGAPLELLDEVAGRPRKQSPARGRSGKTDGKVVDARRLEEEALRKERAELDALKGEEPGRPWERMQLPAPQVAAPPEYVPPLVLADLMELPTARIAPKHKVLAHAQTRFRELGRGQYSNVTSVSQRVQEFDFRIGLTSRLEARVRPYYTTLDLSAPNTGGFSALSSEQGAASFGLRYRLPYYEKLFHMAVGANFSTIQDADRQYYLPDDFERLRDFHFAISHPGGEASSWHLALAWSPLDVPAGSPDNTLFKAGAGVDYKLSQRLRLLGELVFNQLDTARVGRFGTVSDTGHFSFDLGVRSAFRFATIDVFAHRLFTDGFGDFGLAIRTSL
ncbi:MAG: hypothetical protein HYY25_01920 [Candidatus Wallbacteria bacterium]|nr:hypothetical protein [Candidatus Wallbacteria bacterium]